MSERPTPESEETPQATAHLPLSAEELAELREWLNPEFEGSALLESGVSVEGVWRLIATIDRAKLNTRRMALLAETFVYEPRRITEGGLMAQVQRALTDQDVEYEGRAEEGRA